jgi:hypothetical protein
MCFNNVFQATATASKLWQVWIFLSKCRESSLRTRRASTGFYVRYEQDRFAIANAPMYFFFDDDDGNAYLFLSLGCHGDSIVVLLYLKACLSGKHETDTANPLLEDKRPCTKEK